MRISYKVGGKKERENVLHKEDFQKKVGYRIFVVNSISMPGGLFLIRMFFSKVHGVFICEHTHSTIFIKIWTRKPDDRERERERRGRKACGINHRTIGSSPVCINASVAMGVRKCTKTDKSDRWTAAEREKEREREREGREGRE